MGARAFSLLELLVSITIVSVLCGVVFAVTANARKASHRIASISNLRNSAAALLIMAHEENGTLKVWKGGTSGTEGAWPAKLRLRGYVPDTRIFYASPRYRNVEYPTANWYLYTWGMYLSDARASQSINTAPDGYQLRLVAIDNPAYTMLLGDTVSLTSLSAGHRPPRQSFRLLLKTGYDAANGAALQTRDGRTVLMALFDGSVEEVAFPKLYAMGVRRIVDETGKVITLPAN